ncbi:MAG: CsgG/HfaB family protein, partial [Candidatus Tectomicrobia bacterium]
MQRKINPARQSGLKRMVIGFLLGVLLQSATTGLGRTVLTMMVEAAPTKSVWPVVAVLNFVNRSNAPESQAWNWLEKGLADLLITDLATDKTLTVVSREQMQRILTELEDKAKGVYELDTQAAQEVARILKATRLVFGTYEVSRGQLAVHVTLSHAVSGKAITHWNVSGPAVKALDVERQLATNLLAYFSGQADVSAIQAALPRWTDSLSAAAHLYRGIDLWDQGKFEAGWLEFRQAVKQDGQYADAHFWMGRMQYFLHYFRHAREVHQQFLNRFAEHPQSGDAVLEYARTFEVLGAAPDTLRQLYDDLLQMNPQGKVHHIFGYGGFLRTHYATQNILVRQWLLRRLGVTQLMTGQYKKALHTAWEMKRFTAKTKISQKRSYGEYTLLALAASRAHFLNTGSWLDTSGLESDTASVFNPKRTYNRFQITVPPQ